MKTVHVFLIVTTVSLFSCATYRLLPQEDLDNTIKYTRGTQVLYALKDQIGVAITSEVNVDRIYFQLVVRNFRDSSLYLDDSSVKLSEIDATEAAPVDLKVYRADEYYQLRRKQIVTAQVLMAVSAAMSTANAGNSTSYTRGNYSAYGHTRNNYYRGYGSYSSTTYTYDSAKAAMEREIAFSNVRDYVNGTNAELDYLHNTLFYPSDIDSNGEYFGIVVAELGKAANTQMTLRMNFAGVPFKCTFQKQQVDYGTY
jgi:hypothetical protein